VSIERVALVLKKSWSVPGTAKLILIGIANHDGDGGSWPSIETLAAYAEVDRRGVQRHLATMVQKGILTVHANRGGTDATPVDRRPNRYEIDYDYEAVSTLPRGAVSTAQRGGVQGANGAVYKTERGGVRTALTVLEPSIEPSNNLFASSQAIEALPLTVVLASSLDDDFELFWKTYGKVGSKKKARECWERAIRKAAPEVIQAGLERWVEYWMSPEAAKQKWPQGWLSEERWNDDPPFAKSVAPKLTNSTAALKQAMLNRMNQ
jgi:DNA-binding transcriptional regulator YhcF (GntR family)